MLIDYEYKSGKLIVSSIGDDGKIKLKHFDWRRPTQFKITDQYDPAAHPKYRTWDGRKVKSVFTDKPSRYAVYEFLDSLPKEDQAEIIDYKEPNIYFCDIETEIMDTGFVEPSEATSKVLSISVTHNHKAIILGIKKLHQQELFWIQSETNKRLEKLGGAKYTVTYKDFSEYEQPEYEMLKFFFYEMVPNMPVLTGWNFENYDWCFLLNRGKRLGIDVTVSSFTHKMHNVNSFDRKGGKQDYNADTPLQLPYHRIVIDYMELFKKWDTTIKVKESYALDFIAEKVLGGEGKVIFYGGLQNLYEQDYKNYLFYNCIDTILVQLIHEKTKIINILYAIAALARIPCRDALSALRVTEGVMRNDFREKSNIVLCKSYEDSSGSERDEVEGGFVMDPVRGLNKWVVVYDFASLYPTTQRQNNISPENFKGVKDGPHSVDFNGRRGTLSPDDVVCVNDAVFDRQFSVTCNKLTEIYNDRKKFKGKMLKAKDELKQLQNELDNLIN